MKKSELRKTIKKIIIEREDTPPLPNKGVRYQNPKNQQKAQRAATKFSGKTYEQLYALIPNTSEYKNKFPSKGMSPKPGDDPVGDSRFIQWIALAVFLLAFARGGSITFEHKQTLKERGNNRLRRQQEKQRARGRLAKSKYFREMSGVNEQDGTSGPRPYGPPIKDRGPYKPVGGTSRLGGGGLKKPLKGDRPNPNDYLCGTDGTNPNHPICDGYGPFTGRPNVSWCDENPDQPDCTWGEFNVS